MARIIGAEDLGDEHRVSTGGRPSFQQGVIFTSAGTALNIAFLFLETAVATRVLETDSYGVYVLLTVVVNFLVMVVDFGCKTALTQLIASNDRLRQAALTNTMLIFRLTVIAIISALARLGQSLLLPLDPSGALLEYVAYVPLMLAVASLDELFLAALQGFQAYHHMAVAQIARSVLRLCLSTVFLVILKLGVMSLVYSWIISFAASAFYQYLVLPIPKRLRCRLPLLFETLRFGIPLQGTRLLWFVSGRVDVLLLGALAGSGGVAYYNVATRIPAALVNLAQSYIAVYFPAMTALLAGGKRREARRMLDHSLRLMSFGLGLVTLTAVLFSQSIIVLLFSEKYAASSAVFAVLMIALHMTLLVNLMGYALTSAGYPERSLGASVIRTALTVTADVLLIPALGFAGAAWARMIAYYATNPICVWLLRRSGIRTTVAPYLKQTALLWLCVALFWSMRPTAIVYKVAIVVFFFVLNLILCTVSRDDLKLVLPEAITGRLGIRKGTLSNGR